MSDSDRLTRNALIITIIAIVAVAIFWGGWWLGSKKLEYNNARDYRPGQHSSNSKDICIKIPPVISFCPEEQNTASADSHRSDNDLKSQQEMADWAFLMATISAAGLLLSTIGIGLIYVTFRATHSSAVAANDANRPWVEVVIGEMRSFSIKPTHARVAFFVTLNNRGKSPATGVTARAVLIVGGEPFAAVNNLEKLLGDLAIRQPKHGGTIFPGVHGEPQRFGANVMRVELNKAAGGPGNKASFWVAVGVKYKFGNTWCHTIHGYLLKATGRPQHFKVSDEIELGPNEFRLASMGQDYAT